MNLTSEHHLYQYVYHSKQTNTVVMKTLESVFNKQERSDISQANKANSLEQGKKCTTKASLLVHNSSIEHNSAKFCFDNSNIKTDLKR